MNHGIVDVFAYQEALLVEAVFAVAALIMLWVGFRRWLHYKEQTSRPLAAPTASDVRMDRMEARLKAIEQKLIDRAAPEPAELDTSPSHPLGDVKLEQDKA